MSANNGGPAFPTTEYWEEKPIGIEPGMSLRDYFAAKAMTALLSQMTYGNQGQHCGMYDPNDPLEAITLALLAYQAADAMLAQRAKTGGAQ